MLRNFILMFSVSQLSVLISFGQTTVTFQPDATEGKDAYIWYLSNQAGQYGQTNTTNYGNAQEFCAREWTWDSDPGSRKSLIEFDLSTIPSSSTVLSAKLSLYAFPDAPGGGHSTLSGANDSYLRRIVSSWGENTVTWNNQPSVTTSGQIMLSASNSDTQDYLDIDVTTIVQDMVANPSSNFGFMISMAVQDYYRGMVFASSDHPSASKHPKLVVTYNNELGIKDLEKLNNKEVVKIVDLLGRETEYKANTPLIYIYSDGSREHKMTIEK